MNTSGRSNPPQSGRELGTLEYRMNVLQNERTTPGPLMTTDLRNALLIHNPNAGNGGSGRRRTLDAARHIFAAGGIESELAETNGPGHATEMALRAASEGRGLVIACGGDGTLNEVINGFGAPQKGHPVPLPLLSGRNPDNPPPEPGFPRGIPHPPPKL